jgi:hypothetical protein
MGRIKEKKEGSLFLYGARREGGMTTRCRIVVDALYIGTSGREG